KRAVHTESPRGHRLGKQLCPCERLGVGAEVVAHPLDAAWFIVEGAVQLRLKSGVEGLAEMRAGLEAELDEVASHDDWLRRGVLDGEAARSVAEVVDATER